MISKEGSLQNKEKAKGTIELGKGSLSGKLEDSKRPADMKHSDNPNFCPYHRILGHPIEDCWVFKDWVER